MPAPAIGGARAAGGIFALPEAIAGGIIGGFFGSACGDQPGCGSTVNQAKSHDKGPSDKRRQSKPKNAPSGTKPINQKGLSHEQIEKIKSSIGAKPNDWVGVAPDGTVITTDPETGEAMPEGNVNSY